MSGWWLRFNIMICRHSYSDKFYTFFSPFAINCELLCPMINIWHSLTNFQPQSSAVSWMTIRFALSYSSSSSKLKCFRGGEDIIYTAIWSKADKGSSISLLQGPDPRFVNPENVDFFTHQTGVEAKMKKVSFHYTVWLQCFCKAIPSIGGWVKRMGRQPLDQASRPSSHTSGTRSRTSIV